MCILNRLQCPFEENKDKKQEFDFPNGQLRISKDSFDIAYEVSRETNYHQSVCVLRRVTEEVNGLATGNS